MRAQSMESRKEVHMYVGRSTDVQNTRKLIVQRARK